MHVTLNDSHHGRQLVRILSAFSYCLEGTLLPANVSLIWSRASLCARFVVNMWTLGQSFLGILTVPLVLTTDHLLSSASDFHRIHWVFSQSCFDKIGTYKNRKKLQVRNWEFLSPYIRIRIMGSTSAVVSTMLYTATCGADSHPHHIIVSESSSSRC